MNHPALRRTLCIRAQSYNHFWILNKSIRFVSTRSAINRGLRATKDGDDGKRGGRDRLRASSSRSGSGSAFRATERPSNFSPGSDRQRPSFGGISAGGSRSENRTERPRPWARDGKSGSGGEPMRDRTRGSFGRDRPHSAVQDSQKNDNSRGTSGSSPWKRDSESSSDRRPTRDRTQSSFTSGRTRSGFNDRRDEEPRGMTDRFSGRRNSEAPLDGESTQEKSPTRRTKMPLSALNVDNDPRERKSSWESRSKHTDRPRERKSSERSDSSQSPDEPGSPGRLLREIKAACKAIDSIQEAELTGGDVFELKANVKAAMHSINHTVDTGSFKGNPAEAVADMFHRKAADGTFIQGKPDRTDRSMIYQKPNGHVVLLPSKAMRELKLSVRESEDGFGARLERSYTVPSKQRPTDRRNERAAKSHEYDDDGIPVSVPYTTAASEFLYGYNAVLAALKGRRRKLYKLYIHPKIFQKEYEPSTKLGKAANEFVTLAKEAGVPLVNEFQTSKLNKMSDDRPHNGVVLEVSKLPAPPVLSLGKPDNRRSFVPLKLDSQSAEEAAVNGTSSDFNVAAETWRCPLVVMVDGILDPANLGSIIRTCHFYGVDAVAVATNTCANLSSPIVAKASSGGCEAVRLLALPEPSNFVYDSAKAGWKIYAAAASSTESLNKIKKLSTSKVAADSPLAKHPCILMLGAEGEGLRENLKKRADVFVSIHGSDRPADMLDVGVDSLNVGVATGVLLESFLRKPAGVPDEKDVSGELGF